ncbi:MAG TPA: HEAT repeat domain-containing protein, partial [Anaeromyxobacter sp.]|nr:HEAT repeat domain-containing protein [Anaeromyxobacter sp.]
NGKFPVWSMKEINGPCFDVPHSIVVKEIASKVNRAILGFQSTDAAVVALEERAEPKTSQDNGPYMELIELAGTNNPRAMPILKKYAKHKDEFVRAAALDAMGILGAKDELAFLKERYARLESLDRFMALKAIGDVGDDESLRFVADQASDRMYSSEEGMKFLVDLYSGK